MRNAAAIFLVVILTLPFWVKGIVLLHFMRNRAYIVEHFCENKGKPQLHCDGKCYLRKQFKKSQPFERDANTPNLADWVNKWELTDFDLPVRLFEPESSFYSIKKPFIQYWATVLNGFRCILEQPPDLR